MEFLNTCFATTNEVRSLAYYSHLVPIVSTLFLSALVLFAARNRNKAWLFFSFVLLINLWLLGNLITWTSNNYYYVAGFWSALDFINILFYLLILCFAFFQFTKSAMIKKGVMVLGTLATMPAFLITVAGLAVYEFDEPNCEMYGNDFLAIFKLGYEWAVIGLILAVAIYALTKCWKQPRERSRVLITLGSIIGFLAIFSGSEFVATYTDVYEINLYALFSLPVFVLALTYTIFEQQMFDLNVDRLLITRILFFIFIIVGASNLFLIDGTGELITTAASVIVTLGFGVMLLISAARETKQRKEIELLASKLEKANVRLKKLDKQKSEFVSIASHQLRSPLTSIRGYASMLLEGSFGKFPPKAEESIQRIEESAKHMTLAVEDYLNVSRIEAGNMKYNLTDFNLRDQIEHVADDTRATALKKGLILLFRTDLKSGAIVNADVGKTVQIAHNLINNAIKYTEKGTITVFVRDNLKTKSIYVDIIDTGVGMTSETVNTIFQKFSRAEDANKVNTHGTGLGLYVADKMAEAMGGNITVHSEGKGKGSRFTLELPLAM